MLIPKETHKARYWVLNHVDQYRKLDYEGTVAAITAAATYQ